MKSVENQLKNLEKRTSWKKGQTGNPFGRNKGKSITTILRGLLDTTVPDQLMPKQLKDIIGNRKITHREAAGMIQLMGMYGTVSAQRIRMIEMILDRTEGKPLQKIEQTGETDMTLKIIREVIKK